jgi:hypothetical protein
MTTTATLETHRISAATPEITRVLDCVSTLRLMLGWDDVIVAGGFGLHLAQTHFDGTKPSWDYNDIDLYTSLSSEEVSRRLVQYRLCNIVTGISEDDGSKYTRGDEDSFHANCHLITQISKVDQLFHNEDVGGAEVMANILNATQQKTEEKSQELSISKTFIGIILDNEGHKVFQFNIICVPASIVSSPLALFGTFDINVCRVAVNVSRPEVSIDVSIELSQDTREAIQGKNMSFIPAYINNITKTSYVESFAYLMMQETTLVKNKELISSIPQSSKDSLLKLYRLVSRAAKYNSRGFKIL